MVKFSWVFCFVWICPCGSISIGKAGSDNFIEVWCLGWFSFVKKFLDFMLFRFKVGLTEMQIFVLNNHVKQLIVQ